MNNSLGALIAGLLACVVVSGQGQHTVSVCDLTAVNNVTDCYNLDSSTIGRLKFDDYRVTNPAAVQFDPALRLKELAALGPSTTAAMCQAVPTPLTFPGSPPDITFDAGSVKAQIYWMAPVPTFNYPIEFMDVEFSNFKASNGYTSPSFGLRMNRQLNTDGSPTSQYRITLQQGNPGLQNVAGLPPAVGFLIDPESKAATVVGSLPSSQTLSQAIYGVFAHADSILNAATFTVTNPAPAGQTLWTAPEIISLATQAEPWMVAQAQPDYSVPLGPPFKCTFSANGYATCDGSTEILQFANMELLWGGEYLGERTSQSFNVLVNNLRTWASANAPAIDPSFNGPQTIYSIMMDVASSLLPLWPTLRNDPALALSDQRLIDNYIVNNLVALPTNPDFGTFPNDLGEWNAEVAMADAIRRSDHASFAFGIQRFYGSLIQMRVDGSFPLSARLSACSSVYSDADLEALVSIAEMAATQGYDLYNLSVNGKSLETAIQFLLDAYDNPALLYQYSQAGGGACFEGHPSDPPDFNGVFGPGYTSDLAWMEPYLARFPFSATAGRIRKILGSNIAASPFPLMNTRDGLNATCAFRKSFEFQSVNGAKVAIVSGDGQTAGPNQPAPAPLMVRVTDSSGNALAGVLVSFAVAQGSANLSSPAQVLTDATGLASATIAVAGGPVSVTAMALGVPATFSISVPGVAIYSGGIAGIGGSVPALTTISPGALFSLYGQNFAPVGTGGRVNSSELVNGVLPTTLLGVCVSAGGKSAPILDVYPGQINAVAPLLAANTTVDVTVTTGCGTAGAVQSAPQSVTVAPVSPEFLYFAQNANGVNPVAAANSVTGAYVGPAELGAGFAPAHPGDLVTVYASGFGPTPNMPGAPAATPAPVSSVTVRLGSVTLDAADVLYVGPAPGQFISQLNIRIPQGIPAGNQPLQIRFNVPILTSLPGAYLAIAAP